MKSSKKPSKWFVTYIVSAGILLTAAASMVVYVDPFFHYHKPLTDKFYYNLSSERSQNDGITKHFNYNAIITGTSLTENFRTSEADRVFGRHFIKVPYAGGSFKEINGNLFTALETHPACKFVIRGLDAGSFINDKDDMHPNMGVFPTYLYNQNPFDDVQYVWNRDVLYTRCWSMIRDSHEGAEPGITSFDDYSNWMADASFGAGTVVPATLQTLMNGAASFTPPESQTVLTQEDQEMIIGNITQNVTDLADQYPDVEFNYFITPWSIARWGALWSQGTLKRQIDAEKLVIELILPHSNIHLYSWSNQFDLTTDLNNYKDWTHYGEWVNSWMLRQIHDGYGRLTEDNYEEYLKREYDFYYNYDYNSLFNQIDYEADYYAAGLLNQQITGAEPLIIATSSLLGNTGAEGGNDAETLSFRIDDCTDYRALVFYGRKGINGLTPSVSAVDDNGEEKVSYAANSSAIDSEWHMYAVNLAGIDGSITIYFPNVELVSESDSDFNGDPLWLIRDITIY